LGYTYRAFEEVGLTEEVTALHEAEVGPIIRISDAALPGVHKVQAIRVTLLNIRDQGLVLLGRLGRFLKQVESFTVFFIFKQFFLVYLIL